MSTWSSREVGQVSAEVVLHSLPSSWHFEQFAVSNAESRPRSRSSSKSQQHAVHSEAVKLKASWLPERYCQAGNETERTPSLVFFSIFYSLRT